VTPTARHSPDSAPDAAHGGARSVWLLTAAITALAVALYAGWVTQLPAPQTGLVVPWWALVALFVVTESAVAHLEFRREAHTFSLSEIAFTIGLFFAPPPVLIASYLLGSAVALSVVRRQQPIRFAFNIATFAAGGSLAVGVFAALGGATQILSPSGWLAAFSAVVASQLFTTLAIFVAISLSEGEWPVRRLTQIVVVGLSTALVNTSLGLLVVSTALRDSRETVLLVLPSVMLLVAYRAYTSQRRKHEGLCLLSDVSRVLGQAPDTETGIIALLHRTREALRCEEAELVLFPTVPGEAALVATVTSTQEHPLQPVMGGRTDVVAGLLHEGRTVTVSRKGAQPEMHAYVDAYGCRDAIVAPIWGETRTVGALVVRNRMAQAVGFSDSDRTMFETLANHASATLESGRLEQTLARITDLQKKLHRQAYYDALTGLPNRSLFAEQVSAAVEDPISDRLAVMFIDLDEFKAVNDTLGHAAGDQLLAHAAARLQRCLRTDDLVARLGGDEFAVLLVDADEPAADQSAERMIDALGRRFALADGPATVSASIGIAHGSPGYTDAQTLMRNADLALYRAKALGKNRHATFHPSLHLAALDRQRVRAELELALQHDDLIVYYQPYVELRTGRVAGAEALVRWRRRDGTVSPPDTFVPLAEESGLIEALGRNVLEQACRQARTWRHHLPHPEPSVSVNVSAEQLRHARLYDDVRQALIRTGLDPGRLILEITESTLLHDIDATLERLASLKALGIKVAIDDFGTGYSSLAYLRRLPVDVLKLDKSFVDDVADDAEAAALTSGIIRLADSLPVTFIAEGIETSTQRSALISMGCPLGQGFHFARPMPATELDRLLEASASLESSAPGRGG
jgi:diguanylate cyclase (GGDEF)-like protein